MSHHGSEGTLLWAGEQDTGEGPSDTEVPEGSLMTKVHNFSCFLPFLVQ